MAPGMDDDLTLPHSEGGEMFCCFQADGQIIDANEGFCLAVGKQVQDLLGQNLTDVLYGDADQALADIVNRLNLDQYIGDCPCRFKNSQNRPLRQRWSFRAEYDDQGEILIIKGLGYDIRPQKQREIVLNDAWAELKSEMSRKTTELLDMNHRLQQALAERQQAERDYQMLIDNANEMIYVHDLDGRFLSMNGAGRQILGYDFDAHEGKTIFDVLPVEYWAMVKERIQQKMRDNVPTTYTLEAMTRTGNRLALEVSTRLMVRNGRPFAIQGIARDITERKQTELALIQSEQRLMDIINFLPDATFVIDREGKVIAWNRAIEEMTGIRAVDILGQGDYAYTLPFYGEKRPILIDLVLRPMEVGSSQYMDLQYDHDRLVGESYCPCIGVNGAILQGTASPLCDMTGSVVGAIESIRDITERKNTEQQMQSIIDFLPDATFVINRAGKLIAWNRAMEKMSGMKAQDMVGKGNYEYSLPLYGERRPILVDIVLDPTIEPGGEYQDLYRNDDYIVGETLCPMVGINGAVLQCTASVLYDITGSKMGAIETIRDITERRNTEQRMQDIIDFLPDATFVIDNSHKVIAWNRAMEKMTNLRAVDMLGKGDFAYAVPFFNNARPLLVDYILDPNLLCEEDYVYSESDNRYTCEQVTPGLGSIINASASILYDVTGNVVGAIESLRDVTERKNTEQRLQDIIDFLPDATFVIDQAGQVIAWNRAIENMTGIPSHQMIGKGNYEYALAFYGERRPILIDLVLAPDAVGRDKYLSIDSDRNHLSGESFCPKVGNNGLILYGTASPLCDATGKIMGAIESIRDITERKNTEHQLLDIINFLPDATVVVNTHGEVIHWNRATEEMTGIKAEDMVGKGNYEYAIPFYGRRKPALIDGVLHPDLLEDEQYKDIKQKGSVFSGELFCSALGEQGTVIFGTATPLYDVTGTMVGAIETVRDITEQKKIEVALRNSEENFRKLAEIAPAMIFVMQGDAIVYVNKTAEIITGYTQAQLMEQPPGVIIHPDWQDWVEKISLGWQYGKGIPDRYQTRLVKRGGAEVWLDLSVTPVDFNGQPAILGVGIDITERKLAEDEIRYLSYHDKLTGLYNRAYFEEQLQIFDDAQHLPLSLIMGDLNGLKMINDAFGHVKGDQLLRNVARVLESCCRSQDIIARWGGDEFVVLLPNTGEEEAGKIAETISKSCLAFDDFSVQVSISVGIATKSSVAKSMEIVSKEAEDQMYRTKLLDSKSNRSTFMNSLEKTLWVRSHETQAHTHRLRSLVVEIARSLQLSSSDIQSLNLLASLHDIGKIAVPNTILDKPGRLTDEEWEMMKKHPEIGYRIAMSSPELAVIAEAILTHHERWDGTGYPMGLKGSEIPLHARILSIADAYDVMISGRPYQTEISQADALNEIARCAGSQFDPGLAHLFIRLVQTDFAPDECGSDFNCFGWNQDIR